MNKKMMQRWKSYVNESLNNKEPVVVIFGPTGTGKTYYKEYFEKKGWRPVNSYTTREPRPGDDQEYHFINEYEWNRMFSNGLLTNTNSYQGHYYGTNINDFVQPGKSVMISDVTSLNKLKKVAEQNSKEMYFIYAATDNPAVTRERLFSRGTPDRAEVLERELEMEVYDLNMSKVLTLPNVRESLYLAYDLEDIKEFEEQLRG